MSGQPQRITTFLAYDDQAEAAAKFYVGIFPNSRILEVVRTDGTGPRAKGDVVYVSLRLSGQQFGVLNGGPTFRFSDGISLYVRCRTQREVDAYWKKLSSGGTPGRCGWLKDRFGVSWQVIPDALGEMMADSASGNVGRMMEAMFKMSKLDIRKLQQAYRGQ